MVDNAAAQRRIVAPDVARGLALMGIAWANISTGWAVPPVDVAAGTLGGLTPGGGILDEIAAVGSAMFAHVRGLPMFATLLGFGVGLITMSLWRRGFPPGEAQKTLARRYGFLALIGVAHCLFLFFGDIIILYSLLALVLILMMRLRDKTLLIIAGVLFGLHLVATVTMTFLLGEFVTENAAYELPNAETYLGYLGFNAVMVLGYVFAAPFAAFTILPLMIVGFVAARKGVHSHVDAYVRTLWAWVAVTVAVVLLIGLPWGLSAVGVLPDAWETTLSGLNQAFGYLTGPGICAAVLLACRGLQARFDAGEKLPIPVVMASALGKRSMSGYIMQSVLFLVITQEFFLGYGSEAGAFGQFLIALGVWVVLVALAYVLELAGKRGPVEVLHRRLAYGKNGLPQRWAPAAAVYPPHAPRPQPGPAGGAQGSGDRQLR